MVITGLNLVSATPRKSKKISIFLEVEDTDDNIRAFSDMYRKRLVLNIEQDAAPSEPVDNFDLLIDIRSKCQQIRDMITKKLEPATFRGVMGVELSTAVQAADEISDTQDAKIDMMAPENGFYGEKAEDKKDAD